MGKLKLLRHLVSFWFIRLVLILTLILLSCGPDVVGHDIPHTEEYGAWHAAVPQLVEDWQTRELEPTSSIPSISTTKCTRWIDTVHIRHLSANDFAFATGYIPCTEDRLTNCVTGSVVYGGDAFSSSEPYILLSPAENSEGHVLTIRHELAHVLLYCSEPPHYGDYNHTLREDVWGASGVVRERF